MYPYIYIYNSLDASSLSLTTGWRTHIRCLKMQISFRKRATNQKAFLWKITHKYKVSYASLPRHIGCLIYIVIFLQKSHVISGSFV